MNKLLLNGKWLFKRAGSDNWLTSTVPNDNFSDLLSNGEILDPYIGLNESTVQWVGEEAWIYRKVFELSADFLTHDMLELTFEMLDTLCTIFVNNNKIAECNNANIGYVFDVKPYLAKGENTIEVVFSSPTKYIRQKQKEKPLPQSFNGLDGAPYIRKPQCHFGWDWGPTIPLLGMPRDVYLTAYDTAKIDDWEITQAHSEGRVRINVTATVKRATKDAFLLVFELLSPKGEKQQIITENQNCVEFIVDNPLLWWPNGMTDSKLQPLYTLTVGIMSEGRISHAVTKRIGLRTLTLERGADKYGKQFQFIVNGVPIFARGANWIPADSLISRFNDERLTYLLGAVRDGNMNMLRVWGGGYYESDAFYDKCDEYGILVWQDFAYACALYPFYDEEFLFNCNNETVYNIRRLRHHASLALWCGNNELESCSAIWFFRKKLLQWTEKYFWHILPAVVAENDAVTPYIAGSPIGSAYRKGFASDNEGDTHLWAVWHGFKPLTYYRKRYTRFCSEFGLESLPDLKTIAYFASPKDYSMKSDVFTAHQKCKSGNNKICVYVASRFKLPKRLEDLAYLSGLIQGECVKDATEHWRRNRGQCNGSLYWQLNDCWPVNSWAGVDYFGRYKPLQYFAARFNAPQTVSTYNDKNLIRIYAINDRTSEFPCSIRYSLETFDGEVLDYSELKYVMQPVSSTEIKTLNYADLVKKNKGNIVFSVILRDSNDNELLRESVLFKAEKNLALPKAQIRAAFAFTDGNAVITLKTDKFARAVHLDVLDTYKPFSQNYFDMTAGETRIVTFPLDGLTEKAFVEKFSVSSFCDVIDTYSKLHDVLLTLKIRLIPINVINYIFYR